MTNEKGELVYQRAMRAFKVSEEHRKPLFAMQKKYIDDNSILPEDWLVIAFRIYQQALKDIYEDADIPEEIDAFIKVIEMSYKALASREEEKEF